VQKVAESLNNDTVKVVADVPAPQRDFQLLELKGADLPVQTLGQPKDAAAAYIFAMENPYVTGQVLFVDGGFSLT
jgi:NAD(P)-dependent dehydrogenase (short-subunit alcohol dehydrogenase family)